MQLELAVDLAGTREVPALAPRVLALCLTDLPLQRVLRARGASGPAAVRRQPLAVEREGRVVACDAEARARGVAVGDALARARAACGELEVLASSEAEDRAALEGLAEALFPLAPAVEVALPDTLLLDASGARIVAAEEVRARSRGSGWGGASGSAPGAAAGWPVPTGRAGPDPSTGAGGAGGDVGRRAGVGGGADGGVGAGGAGAGLEALARCEALLAERAVALAHDLGWRCRAALASGRGPSRALARHGPPASPVPPGATAAALARLPLAALDLPPLLAGRLAALGLREVGELARLPAETLAPRLGPAGLAAWRLATGDDPTPLVPFTPAALPQEALELEAPVEGTEPLLFGLRRLCDHLAARLAGRGLGALRLELALRLDPSGEERLELALASPTSAAARWILVLRERLGALRLPGAVVGAVLSVQEAGPAPVEQLALGDRPEQQDALDAVLSRLAGRLGPQALFAAEPVERHRPERAYVPSAFGRGRARAARARARRSPADGAAHAAGLAGVAAAQAPAASELVRPTRLLPRPQPLLALGEGGRLTAVRAGGRTLRVLALGPAERLAGEWWAEPFDRDYHRAHVEGLGDCWIFRDARDGRLWLHGFFD